MNTPTQVLLTLWTAAILSGALTACAPPQPEPQSPGTEAAPKAQPPAETQASAPAAPTPSATPSVPPPKENATPPPPTEQECRDRAAKITPPASTATEVVQQFKEFFNAYHESFRCCFDALHAPSNPGKSAKVTMLVDVDGDGHLKKAEIIAAESDPVSAQTQKCMVDIAVGLSYPKPASSKAVGYKRIFDFKARR